MMLKYFFFIDFTLGRNNPTNLKMERIYKWYHLSKKKDDTMKIIFKFRLLVRC